MFVKSLTRRKIVLPINTHQTLGDYGITGCNHKSNFKLQMDPILKVRHKNIWITSVMMRCCSRFIWNSISSYNFFTSSSCSFVLLFRKKQIKWIALFQTFFKFQHILFSHPFTHNPKHMHTNILQHTQTCTYCDTSRWY